MNVVGIKAPINRIEAMKIEGIIKLYLLANYKRVLQCLYNILEFLPKIVFDREKNSTGINISIEF